MSRLLSSFRSGNLAEDLGVFLLKQVSAVAAVPRQEDVGVDAVCNLLRLDNDKCLYAEEGFSIQFKAASVKEIEYEGHSLKWLRAQSLPMFIGSVSLKDARIELRSTLGILQAAMVAGATHVKAHLSSRKEHDPFPFSGKPPAITEVWLKEPLVSWSVEDLQNKETVPTICACLKRWFEIARGESERVSLGQWSKIEWKSNDSTSIAAQLIGVTPQSDLQGLFQRSEPYLRSLMNLAFSINVKSKRRMIMEPILELVENLSQLGVDMTAAKHFKDLAEVAEGRHEMFERVGRRLAEEASNSVVSDLPQESDSDSTT